MKRLDMDAQSASKEPARRGQEPKPLSQRAQVARRSVVAPFPVATSSLMGRQAACVFGSVGVAIGPPLSWV